MFKSIITGAFALLASMSWGIGASQEWVKDYITRSAPTTNIVDSINAILQSKTDDEIHVDAGGNLYYTVLECIDGYYTNTVHYLRPSNSTWNKGTHYGAIVKDSTYSTFKRGEILAWGRDTGGSFWLVNGTRKLFAEEYDENTSTGTIRKVSIGTEDGNMEAEFANTQKECTLIRKDASGNELSFVTLEPMLMTQETWAKTAANSGVTYEGVTNSITWAEDATVSESTLSLTFNVPVAMFRSGGAPTAQPTTINILFLPYPVGNMVDTIEYAAANGYVVDYYGEMQTPTPDNCWAEPSMIYDPRDWNNLANWAVLPQTVTAYYQADDGLWYETQKKIRTLTALENLLKAYPGVQFPPRAWPGFKLVAKEDCRKSGDHIYGEKCICINCGHQRNHVFEIVAEGKCARCINHLDNWVTDIHGQKKKKGVKEQTCALSPHQAGGEWFDIGLHSGWHHDYYEMNESYNCSCECGFYSLKPDGNLLMHLFNYTEGDPIEDGAWSKYNKQGQMDGIHHFARFQCERDCSACKEVKERHEIAINPDEREDGSAEYVDAENHHAPGYCAKCGFGQAEGEEALILEEHQKDDNCFCRLCQTSCHNWHTRPCGKYQNAYCADCGAESADDEAGLKGHAYPVALGEHHAQYRTHHGCVCGLGELEPHNFVDGVCACGVKEKQGVKCASKRNRSNETTSENGHDENCEHSGGFYCSDPNATSSGGGEDDTSGICPDCGGSFWTDYPDAKAVADKAAKWEWTIRDGSGTPAKMDGSTLTLTDALAYVKMTVSAAEESRKWAGTTIEVIIYFNPVTEKTVTVENFSFFGNTVFTIKGNFYKDTARYYGTIVEDPDWGTVIKWQ